MLNLIPILLSPNQLPSLELLHIVAVLESFPVSPPMYYHTNALVAGNNSKLYFKSKVSHDKNEQN